MPELGIQNIEQVLAQLGAQQAAITAALKAMGEGHWLATDYGADSVEAYLLALNPTFEISPRKPLYERNAPSVKLDSVWVPSPNHFDGRDGFPVIAIVLHTMAGTLASCDNWFANENSMVSAHFGVGLDGTVHQYVHLQDGSWANGVLEQGNEWTQLIGNSRNPNFQTVSIETEDLGLGSTPVSDQQFHAVIDVCRYTLNVFPGIRWLFGHRIISPLSRSQCCGNRWWTSRFSQLADILRLQAVK